MKYESYLSAFDPEQKSFLDELHLHKDDESQWLSEIQIPIRKKAE